MWCSVHQIVRKSLICLLTLLLGSSVVSSIPEAIAENSTGTISSRLELDSEAASYEQSLSAEELGYVPDEIIVVYEEDISTQDQERVAAELGDTSTLDIADFDSGDVALVDINDNTTVENAIEAAQSDPSVKYAFPNFVATTCDIETDATQLTEEDITATVLASLVSGDQGANNQWHLAVVKATEAWQALVDSGRNFSPVKVAVLDTGAKIDHPDLKNILNMTDSGEVVWNSNNIATLKPLRGDGYTNGSSKIDVYSTHGTHVAGLIAGEANNGGILGVASVGTTKFSNTLVDLSMIDIFSKYDTDALGTKTPSATYEDFVFGLRNARDAGAKVINLSLGFVNVNPAGAQAMNSMMSELANKNDIVIVSAAGNNTSGGTTDVVYPAACDDVLSVIAMVNEAYADQKSTTSRTWITNGYFRAYFSNYGKWCSISAPGENVYSCLVSSQSYDKVSYGYMSGTSQATPIVTAGAALVRVANPELTAAEVRTIICETAYDLNTQGFDAESGYGLLDIEKAVKKALSLAKDASGSSSNSSGSSPVVSSPTESTNKVTSTTPTWKIASVPSASNKTYNGYAKWELLPIPR
jgi:subtilisin family serine protease